MNDCEIRKCYVMKIKWHEKKTKLFDIIYIERPR